MLRSQVRRQQAAGTFTGICRKDVHVGKRRPEVGPWAQSLGWATTEVADDAGGRRRSRYVIFCPRCGAKRLVAKAQARGEITEGTFTLLCAQCRVLT